MSTKKIFLTVFFSIIALFAFTGYTQKAHASVNDNFFGTAYSSNVGWISFNNCSSATDTSTDCTGSTQYGVTMDPSTGNLSGEAWSSEIGWISFNETSGFPSGGSAAKIDLSTGAFSGFAWTLSNDTGWTGWIDLGSTGHNDGWNMDTTSGAVTGAAWGDVIVGWVVPSGNLTVNGGGGGKKYTITSSVGSTCGISGISPLGSATVKSGDPSKSYTITVDTNCMIQNVTLDDKGTSTKVGNVYTFDNTTVTANRSIAVDFVASPQYTITACAPVNGTISPAGATNVSSGSSKSYTITPSLGYTTATLTVDNVAQPVNSQYTFTNVAANHSICATFTPSGGSTYTITACPTTNGVINPAGVTTVAAGSSKTYTISPKSGYSIYTVTIDGLGHTVVPAYTFGNIKGNHTICATFTSSSATGPFKITACSYHPNGLIAPAGNAIVPLGGSQAYTITPSPTYYIETLNVDGSPVPLSSPYIFNNVTSNHTICATFTKTKPDLSLKQCQDGVDNDQDGLIDYVDPLVGRGDPHYPGDPGCTGPTDDSEKTISVIYIEQ